MERKKLEVHRMKDDTSAITHSKLAVMEDNDIDFFDV